MSLYDGIEVETAPISSLYVEQQSAGQKEKGSIPMDTGLPPSKSATQSSEKTDPTDTLSTSLKFLAPHIQRKKATAKAVPQRSKAPPSTAVLGGGSSTVTIQGGIMRNQPSELVEDEFAMGMVDEYDPFYPNDYDAIMKERRGVQEEEDGDGADVQSEHRSSRHESGERKRRHSSGSDDEEERRKDSRRKDRAAIPPPMALSNEESSSAGSKRESKRDSGDDDAAIPVLTSALLKKAPKKQSIFTGKFGGSKVASQIMNKYGWKEGQGLGKAEQGISTALAVEKTSKRGGKIINMHQEQAQAKEEEEAEEAKKVLNITEIMKNPSKVILLKNMVGPGDVDEDLQPEVSEECTKYGEVVKCIAYEIPGLPDDEAVRIFVEFSRVEAAIKAVVDLNGRFFGGRTVAATFFDFKRFANYDLAP